MKRKTGKILFLLFLGIIAGCAGRKEIPPVSPPLPPLVRVESSGLPLFTDDIGFRNLELAVGRSLQYYDRFSGDRVLEFGNDRFTVAELRESLLEFLRILRTASSEQEFRDRIGETFLVYRAAGRDGNGSVLFTGYYEPTLEGNWFPTDRFRYPLYGKPGDQLVINLGKFDRKYRGVRLVGRVRKGEVIPYYTREEIEKMQSLAGRDLEILWVSDPIALFFLHIQGSGLIELPDGTPLHVTYADSNGRPYRSIGKRLIELERIAREDVSLQSIRRYLADHPEEMEEILNYNESYVFFRIARGAIGSLGVPVTADRSIATDGGLFPRGALAFVRTWKPVVDGRGNILEWVPFSRFVLNQDAGGAIKGPGRVDLFCGNGGYAETMAGHMKQMGDLFFLVKRRK
jgi:membrane-bound lytic murein transglycosylase A